MKWLIVAVGQRMPDWAQTAYDDYAKRFPPDARVEIKTVKTEPRGSKTLETLLAAERARIEAVIPKGARVVVLDERGTTLTTVALAQQWRQWQLQGDDVVFVIGGPDGLGPVLAQHPEILLFDEVTAALDPEMVREVLDVTLDLAREGKTMIIVTHEMQFARAVANRVLFFDGGRIVEEAAPAQFFDHPQTERAKKFLNTFTFDAVK